MKHVALVAVAVLACQPGAPPEDASASAPDGLQAAVPPMEESPTSFLALFDLESRAARYELPGRLDEISGLAVGADGRLFAHDDERGRIHVIDPATGEVGKRWDLGEDLVRDDFEGIALIGERFFLVSSRGILYEFREGADRENVAYRRTDSGVGAGCEVEGLDYDPDADVLLLACKVAVPNRHQLVVHSLPVDPTRDRPPPLRLDRARLAAVGVDPDFEPSAIAVTPTGTLLLLSASTEAILELERDGTPIMGLQLSKGRHPQPEGLAIGIDGRLYIADEQNDDDARVTVYAQRGGGS